MWECLWLPRCRRGARSAALPPGILGQALAPHVGPQAARRVHAAHPQAGAVLDVPVHVVKELQERREVGWVGLSWVGWGASEG